MVKNIPFDKIRRQLYFKFKLTIITKGFITFEKKIMNLLFKKSDERNVTSTGGVNISSKSISINGYAVENLMLREKDYYGAVGFDDDDKLSLFITTNPNKNLFKLSKRGKNGSYRVMQISNEEHQKAISPYIGKYDIENMTLVDDDIRKVNLKLQK